MPNQALVNKVNQLYGDPRVRAFLDTIAYSEGTYGRGNNGYDLMFGGGQIRDLSKHPEVVHKFRDKSSKTGVSPTTAAGRYQMLSRTWRNAASTLGLTDFSPASQDKAAILLLVQNGAANAILQDDVATAIQKANGTWTSFAGSVEGARRHGVNKPEAMLGWYNKARAAHGLQPVTMRWGGKEITGVAPTNSAATGPGSFYAQAMRRMYGNRFDQAPGYLRHALEHLNNPLHSTNGIPVPMDTAGSLAISASPVPDDATVNELAQRLYQTRPDESYGVSFTDGGLRPTIQRVDPVTGNLVNMVEYPNGVYVNAETGERVNRQGTITPMVYDATTGQPWPRNEDGDFVAPDPAAQPPAPPPVRAPAPALTSPEGAIVPDAPTVGAAVAPSGDAKLQAFVNPLEAVNAADVVAPGFSDYDMSLRQRFRQA